MNKVIKIVSVLSLVLLLVIPVVTMAEGDIFGTEAVGEATGLGGGPESDLRATIGSLIKTALGFLGVIAIIIVLIGGFKYMTAGGNDEKVKEARKWIISGVIGIAIILSAYLITSFVLTQLSSATGVTE